MSSDIKRLDAGLLTIVPAGIEEESGRETVAMPDTILAKERRRRMLYTEFRHASKRSGQSGTAGRSMVNE